MPFQSTGAASPDLSTFTGTNTGFTGGGGFGFGKLLQDRWDMQKKMLEAQLAQMEEQLKQAKEGAGVAQVERQTKDLYKGRRDLAPGEGKDLQRGRDYQDAVEYVRGLTSGDPRTKTGGGRNARYLQDMAGQVAAMGVPAAQAGLMQTGRLQSGMASAAMQAGKEPWQVTVAKMQQKGVGGPETADAGGGPSLGDPEIEGTISGYNPNIGGADLAMLAKSLQDSKGGSSAYSPGYTSTPGFYMTPSGITNTMKPLSPMEMPGIGGPPMKKGGYVPKTGPYKLHKGEIVLNPQQSKAMFPGAGPGPQRRGYQAGSVPGVPSFYGGPSAGPQSPAQSPWTGPVGRGSAPAPTPSDSPWGDLGALGAVGMGPGTMAAMYYMKDVLKDFWKQDAPTEEALNKALEKIGNPPVKPEGVLGKDVGAEAPVGLGQAPTGISREGGIPKLTLKGAPESQSEKFQKYVDELQEKVKKSAHDEKMARANAYNLETQINKRPYADNKQLKKMMGARTQEADRHKKSEEAARSEYSAIKVKQQAMDTELAKAYQLNRTAQLDTAFDAIDQYWKTAVKVDDGDDKFVEYSMGMLLPYMDQFQQLGGFSSMEETQEALRQTMSNAYERPEEYQWLKLMLQQGR